MTNSFPLADRVALTLTALEDRSVPSASAALDPRSTTPAEPDDTTGIPQSVQVGTDEQGEAVYTITVSGGRCNCMACRGLPPADTTTTAPQVADPVAEQAPAPAHVATLPARTVAPERLFGSDPTAVTAPATSPTPVAVASTESGYTLLVEPDVTAEAEPDVVSTPAPAPAVLSVAPFGGIGWRWVAADPLAGPDAGRSA